MEVNIGDRSVQMEIISREKNKCLVSIDNNEYELDIKKMKDGIYSIIKSGKSYNFEVVKQKDNRNYSVSSSDNIYNIEIVDALNKYKKSRQGVGNPEEAKIILSPMPGKVVRILVNEGDPVEVGQTLIIVSAMKMDSEYKASLTGFVSEVNVEEGETVDSNQVLIKLSD